MPTELSSQWLLSICVALGIGLLIGAERERRKGSGPQRAAAGIRTFSVAALTGVVAMFAGEVLLMAAVALVIGGFGMLAYSRSSVDDPGLTTEIALFLTCLLGGLAAREPLLAAGLGVLLASLLALREHMHNFVRGVLSERELHDALLFAAATLIVLPLAPDRYVGPYAAINPHALAGVVVLVMLVSALGYIALRVVGPRYGLPLAGFISGFVSSSATIHALGQRARGEPTLMPGLVAGAVLSSVATIVQLAAVIALLAPSMLVPLFKPMLFAGLAALLYAGWFTWRALRTEPATYSGQGRAFNLGMAFGFAGLVGTVMVIAAALNHWLGGHGVLVTMFVSGLADAHAAAAAAASLQSTGKIDAPAAVLAVLVGLSANTLVKVFVAVLAGGHDYAWRIVPGLMLMMIGAWGGLLL